jgi:hypothetical protein
VIAARVLIRSFGIVSGPKLQDINDLLKGGEAFGRKVELSAHEVSV